MFFRDFDRVANSPLRSDALAVIETALDAAIPARTTQKKVVLNGDILLVDGQSYDLKQFDRIRILGAGKASYPIALALENILGDKLTDGVLVIKKGDERKLKKVRVIEGSHPVPDASSVEAGVAMLEFAESCGERDLIFAPITGGATSLATVPLPGLALEDLEIMNELVLKSGANIREMNVVRRHLCKLKGGRLASITQPAILITLTLDTALPGMPWPDMCLPDPATSDDAVSVMRQYGIWEQAPAKVRDFLQAANPKMETVKDFTGFKCQMVFVGDPVTMCQAAAQKASELGYTPLYLASRMHGEARETGKCIAGITEEILQRNTPVAVPCAIITSGECNVTINGTHGRGGPNQEFAISFADQIWSGSNWVCVAVDTDGTDGPTDWAGGIVDGRTRGRARELGVRLEDAVFSHDCGTLLEQLGDSLVTGHTGTNLQHLRVVLIGKD